MKIFGNPMSTCTRKVLMTLGEKQAKFDFVAVDFAKGEHKSAENVARQPFGQVPALEDGDFKMFESRAMIRYIDEAVEGAALSPKDAKGRALMNQWISVESEDFTPALMMIIRQELFEPMFGGKTDAAKVEEGKKKLAPALAVLEKHLADGHPYLVGKDFTLADIAYMPYLDYGMKTSARSLIQGHKHVAAWWERISARPTWKHVAN